MESNNLMNQILALEWSMFQSVNGAERVDCQENEEVFTAMRTAQFSAWSFDALESYLEDLRTAQKSSRNLIREKYIRMMASTDPDTYTRLSQALPPLNLEVEELADTIWSIMLRQTEAFRRAYPYLAAMGRPLHAAEESDGWASVETYERGELMTCSRRTLRSLLSHIQDLDAQGVSFVETIQKNSVLSLGYASLEDAEQAAVEQYIRQMGGWSCSRC